MIDGHTGFPSARSGAGNAADAVTELSTALQMWRGEPYAELAASEHVDATRGRLAELHAAAGDHSEELIPQIQQVCAGLDEDDPLELCDQHYLLGFAAVMIGRADIALPAVERAVAVALRTGVRGVLGPARAIHSVALLLEARLAGDDAELMRAVGELRSFTRGWTGALAQAAFGQAHLLCSPDAPDAAERAAVAVAALHDAAAAFHRESDVPFGLSALHLGVVALARVGHTAEARHLLADVRGYGRQLGAFLGPNDDQLGNELAALDDLPVTARFDWDRAIGLLAPRSSDATPRVPPRRTARRAAQAGES